MTSNTFPIASAESLYQNGQGTEQHHGLQPESQSDIDWEKRYNKKLWGWLSYAFASEAFVIVSLTLFLPICLEQFARDNGFLLPNKTVPCLASTSTPANGTTIATAVEEVGRCVVKIGWVWVDSASFSLYVYSISVALQAFTVISMGGVADHPPHRLLTLLLFATLGSLSATSFLFLSSSSPAWWVVVPLAICANVGFGASTVAMNAYLPGLGRSAHEVRKLQGEINALGSQEYECSENEPLLGRDESDAEVGVEQASLHALRDLKILYNTTLSRTTSRISSLGIASGYAAGIFMLFVALVPVTLMKGSTLALRTAIGMSGVWWGAWTVASGLLLRAGDVRESFNRGEIVDDRDIGEVEGKEWNLRREIVASWVRLANMLRWREIKKLRETFKFLGAWFMLSDGFTTLTSTAILFAKTTLHMPPSSLILIGILTPLSGIIGSLIWPRIQRKAGWSNLKVLVILVGMAGCVAVYGCLGLVIEDGGVGSKVKFGGLTTPGEMYVLAVYFGSVYGAFQGYARAFYAELLPPGEEARWFGLFSITDKSSSFLGPLIVGLIADTTGNIRYSFFFLVFMIWGAIPVLGNVDVRRGREDSQGYAKTQNISET